jgi:hypothetical protein
VYIDNVLKLQDIQDHNLFVYPVTNDSRLHNSQNNIIGLIIIECGSQKVHIVGTTHPETHKQVFDYSIFKDKTIYCYNKNLLRYKQIKEAQDFIDVELQYYLYTNQSLDTVELPIIKHYTHKYPSCHQVNKLVSLSKHAEIAKSIFENGWVKQKQAGLEFYDKELIPALYNIEKEGLHVDSLLYKQCFGNSMGLVKDKCYTQYNYYTATGRPSNRFGGINYAALNKEDASREVFTSRFANGTLVEIDFNSYHPRLIAQLIDYDFGDNNVYEYLARYYYNTSNPTQDEIEKAKEETFKQIYGGVRQQYTHIPFFNKANTLVTYLWNQMEEQGYVESPISGRRLHQSNYADIDKHVLFNYFIQMFETEMNTLTLNKIHTQLLTMESKAVLYTYDSILFDVPQNELEDLIHNIIPKCVDLKKYPIKVKTGKCYKNMTTYIKELV